MTRTKSMVYKPSEGSRELVLCAINDGSLYRGFTIPIIKCLHKKAAKGIYDSEKAVDLWYNLATQASDKYNREFGYRFTVTERYTAAVEFESYYKEQVQEG